MMIRLKFLIGLLMVALTALAGPPSPPVAKPISLEEGLRKRSVAQIRAKESYLQAQAEINRKLLEAAKSPENKAVWTALERRRANDQRLKLLNQNPQRASAPFETLKRKR